MDSRVKPFGWARAALLACLVFLLLLFFVPVSSLFIRAPSLELAEFWPTALTRALLRISLLQAGLSSAISLALGIPLALFLFWTKSSDRLSRWLLMIPYAIPSFLVAMTWLSLSRSFDFLPRYSLSAVVLAHIFLNAPLVALMTLDSLNQTPRALLESAISLGASKIDVLRDVLWPSLKWSAFAAGAQVFSLCLMSYSLVLILGGGPPVESLETALVSEIRLGHGSEWAAHRMAFLQLGLNLVAWGVVLFTDRRAKKRASLIKISGPTCTQRVSSRRPLVFVTRSLTVLWLLPFLVMGVLPFFKQDATVSSELFSESFLQALFLSLKISFIVSLLSVSLAVCCLLARDGLLSVRAKNLWSVLATLPGSISAITLGFCFWQTYERWIDPFEGSLVSIILLEVALFTPFCFRWLSVRVDTHRRIFLEEAALSLGAGRLQAWWRAVAHLIAAPCLLLLALTAGASLGEYGIMSLFANGRLVTLPLFIQNLRVQYEFDAAEKISIGFLVLIALVMGFPLLLSQIWIRLRHRNS